MRSSSLFNATVILLVVIAAAPALTCITIFAHEGGHGLLIVPAILLNGQIPDMPTEQSEQNWNPFPNFPAGIVLFFLSFPLGVVANGLISWLAYKNAHPFRLLSQSPAKNVLMGVFLSLCIMNFKSVLSNVFGQDFSFVWEFLHFPYQQDVFRNLLKVGAFLVFPAYVVIKKKADGILVATVSAGTFFGSYLTGRLLFEPLQDEMMTHFWWLFITGLPVLIITVVVLWMRVRNQRE
ncbi:MAG: hypothetical protein WBA22_06440 [Candidatus Methanofastidiosia archaeon]